MTSKLLISSVPSDSHAETNMVYVHPQAAITKDHVRIRDYVFRVGKDVLVKPGELAMNIIQRKACKVTTNLGDTVDLAPSQANLPPMDEVLLMVKLDVENFVTGKKGGTIDYARFVEQFKKQFENQFFASGQMVFVNHDSTRYIVNIREPQYIKAVPGVSPPSSPAQAAAAASHKDPEPDGELHQHYGLLTGGTMVRLVSERSGISFINVPNKIADSDRAAVVKDFNLEKLGIGGLRKEFGEVFRRAFASRIFPQSIVKKLGIPHVKGVLLFGPPGTGKTLIARKIGEVLNGAPPKIVNGPEVFTKWVGGAEEKIRLLFADAEAEFAAKDEMSQLHLIIFDEFDAICRSRGSTGDNTGVQDNVVNQLLSKIDGVQTLNNVLLIGMTNRKDRLDEAVLRPGRFEVHVEIGLPDETGRQEILRIHTKGMLEAEALYPDVDLAYLAHETRNYSGAEIQGLVRAAQSHAFSRHIDFENPTKVEHAENINIKMQDFVGALADIKPAFGQAIDECKAAQRHGIIDYGQPWQRLKRHITEMVLQLRASNLSSLSLLVHGEAGTGKSSLAAFTAMASEYPYVKFLSAAPLVGYNELAKCNIVRKAFEDSYKSPLSVVILDDMERLIELSQGGARYSNALLQTLLVLIKAQPPEGKKLLVIGTTSLKASLEQLELAQCFAAEVEAPLIPPSCLCAVSVGLKARWTSPGDEQQAAACLPEAGLPLKKLITLIEMATGAATDAGDGGSHRVVTFERFSDALLQLGLQS